MTASIRLQISIILGVILTSFTAKTPNYGWMGAIPSPSKLLETSTWDFIIPVFRPLLPLEKLDIVLFGNIWLSDNLLYGVFTGLIIYLLTLMNKKIVIYLLFSILPLFFIAADGGVIYDIIFVFSLLFILYLSKIIIIEKSKKISSLFYLGIVLALADLSRPFFLPYLLIYFPLFYFYFYKTFKDNISSSYYKFLPVFMFFILVAPFHISQFKHTDSLILSNYGGCNLGEVFHVKGRMPLNRGQLNTIIETKECKKVKNEILTQILDNPRLLLLAGALPEKINHIFYPPLSYHGNGAFSKEVRSYYQDFFYLGISIIYLLFLVYIIQNLIRLDFIAIVLFGFLGYYLLIMLYAHNGNEQIRMSLPMIVSMLFYISHATMHKKIQKYYLRIYKRICLFTANMFLKKEF